MIPMWYCYDALATSASGRRQASGAVRDDRLWHNSAVQRSACEVRLALLNGHAVVRMPGPNRAIFGRQCDRPSFRRLHLARAIEQVIEVTRISPSFRDFFSKICQSRHPRSRADAPVSAFPKTGSCVCFNSLEIPPSVNRGAYVRRRRDSRTLRLPSCSTMKL